MYDVAVIGGGVIGTSIARELSKYRLKCVLIEKTNDVANGTSKANSAIVHAGYDAPYNTLKGQYNKLGSDLYEQLCLDLDVHYKRVGSFVLAFEDEDYKVLNLLKDNGEKLGIKGLSIVDRTFILSKEPNITPEVIGGLYAPSAAITDPFGLTVAMMENAMDNGVDLMMNFPVNEINREKEYYNILSGDNRIQAKYIVNAAGVYADEILKMVDSESTFKIRPRRGQYYLLDKSADGLVNSVIFQCPGKKGKGVVVAPTVDGNVLIGPTSEDLEDKNGIETTKVGLDDVKVSASKAIENIPFYENITTFAGLRAESNLDDFLIGPYHETFYNVAGIKSPGLSAAPAIAEKVSKDIAEYFKAERNLHYNPKRSYVKAFMSMTLEEKNNMIEENPMYGNVICRCEQITEGEIVESIHRNCGGRTVNGIKRRIRPGAGRCQGGFCMPKVIEILSRELNIPQEEIVKENQGSYILTGRTKAGATCTTL
ncbi:MAG: FAD-dependent oxidoreductase [Clostridia bacterium]|nr:FAD-dependent oxidoreductase [Clostridia bacterium]